LDFEWNYLTTKKKFKWPIALYLKLACRISSLGTIGIAVWGYNYFITAVTVGLCTTNIGFLIYGSVVVRSKWSDESRSCIIHNSDPGWYNVIVTTATDIRQLIF